MAEGTDPGEAALALEAINSGTGPEGKIFRKSQALVVLLLLQVAAPLFLLVLKYYQEQNYFVGMKFRLSWELMMLVSLPITLGSIWVARELIELALKEAHLKEVERFAFLGRLSAALAHEVRNPGTAVVGFLQLVERVLEQEAEIDRGQARQWIKIARGEMDRIMQLVTEFLMLSRPDRTSPGCVDLSRVAREVVEALGPKAVARSIELHFASSEAVNVVGNAQSLRQAVMNLVINALESTDPGGRIEVEVAPTGEKVAVSVKDTGAGIDPEHLAEIFEPFFTTKDSGTGLGLAISQKIIRDHGGAITVESQPGHGSIFKVKLPKEEYK